ncbi:MAG: DUF523 and DUF1722 domain-containing protein [Gammaproteobacteria bacterium]|nr:DUF523 and DUF1722 domain-containing protein [Gammaproteobacteria bacterium]MDH5630802.1 DUF523 and DUF1722 domain-containing protein [Gammaproteobacteria bacterium]
MNQESMNNVEKIKIGLSACLAGKNVRYNGGHTQSALCLKVLAPYFEYLTFCPEAEAGFGIPRPAMRLSGDPDNPSLTLSSGESDDMKAQLMSGISANLNRFDDIDGYILMKNSPSCGLERIKVYQANGHPHEKKVSGLFTQSIKQQYPLLPLEEDGRLHDPKLRENFILRVYTHFQFRKQIVHAPTLNKLFQFHSQYKYILMAHNQDLVREMGRMLADGNKNQISQLTQSYFEQLMSCLKKPASHKNQTNALLHLLGYLKKEIPAASRQHIAEVIHQYRNGLVPLVAPMTLLKHYAQQSENEYFKFQQYWQPYPEDLKLINQI